MTRTDAIVRLNSHAQAIRALGATALYLFGSTARDEPGARDLDLFIDYDANQPFSLFDLVGIKQLLEENLKAEIDVTTRDSLHPMLRAEIEQSAIRVF